MCDGLIFLNVLSDVDSGTASANTSPRHRHTAPVFSVLTYRAVYKLHIRSIMSCLFLLVSRKFRHVLIEDVLSIQTRSKLRD